MKYIILSNLGEYNNLGHELFFTRKILFVLLHHNLIKTDVTLVTSYNDRKFLYNKYFNNVITFKEFDSISRLIMDFILTKLNPYMYIIITIVVVIFLVNISHKPHM